MPTFPTLQTNTLSIVTNAQRDAERYAMYAARMIAPYAQTLANLHESQRRMALFMAPALESLTQFHRMMRVAVEDMPRFDIAMKATITPLTIPSQREWAASSTPRDHKIIESKCAVVELPSDTRWEHLELRFKDPHTLSVFYKGRRMRDCDYSDLGFARKNTRDRKPDKQWGLLIQLSIIAEQKKIMVPTTENLSRSLNITKAALQKNKQALARKLSSALGIVDSPFNFYDTHCGYQLKCKLRSESLLRGDGELHRSGGRLLDNAIQEEDFEEN